MKIFNDEAPIYLQLRQHIEELILDKALQEDSAIPSIRNMARDYSLNPITVGNALSLLVEFVSPDARRQIIETRGQDFITDKLEPVIVNARQLEIPRKKITQIIEEIYGGTNE